LSSLLFAHTIVCSIPLSFATRRPGLGSTELLLANDGASTAGKFLIRCKGNSETEFILSVIYKSQGTHHTVVRPEVGEEFLVNKTSTNGATTLEGVVAFLRDKNPKWPVPLTEEVPS
jgi:hypothetical protein